MLRAAVGLVGPRPYSFPLVGRHSLTCAQRPPATLPPTAAGDPVPSPLARHADPALGGGSALTAPTAYSRAGGLILGARARPPRTRTRKHTRTRACSRGAPDELHAAAARRQDGKSPQTPREQGGRTVGRSVRGSGRPYCCPTASAPTRPSPQTLRTRCCADPPSSGSRAQKGLPRDRFCMGSLLFHCAAHRRHPRNGSWGGDIAVQGGSTLPSTLVWSAKP